MKLEVWLEVAAEAFGALEGELPKSLKGKRFTERDL